MSTTPSDSLSAREVEVNEIVEGFKRESYRVILSYLHWEDLPLIGNQAAKQGLNSREWAWMLVRHTYIEHKP